MRRRSTLFAIGVGLGLFGGPTTVGWGQTDVPRRNPAQAPADDPAKQAVEARARILFGDPNQLTPEAWAQALTRVRAAIQQEDRNLANNAAVARTRAIEAAQARARAINQERADFLALQVRQAAMVQVRAAAPVQPQNRPQIMVNIVVRGERRVLALRPPEAPTPPPADATDFDGPDDRLPQPVNPRININDYIVAADSFDQWVFGGQVDPDTLRSRLEASLQARLAEVAVQRLFANPNPTDRRLIDQVLGGPEPESSRLLTGDEIAKLQLAGRGDIKRYLDELDAKRAEFAKTPMTYRTGVAFLQTLEPLMTGYRRGIFGDDSLFSRTLKAIKEEPRKAP